MFSATVYDHGDAIVLTFEHSLLSLSKWEARTGRPFLTRGPKSNEEMLDYYGDMLTSPEHDPDLVFRMAPADMDALTDYMNSTQSASTLPGSDGKRSNEVVTSETLYMQMAILKIPFESTEKWHLNRLMILIAKVSEARTPPKKEDRKTALSRWADLNERNKQFFKSKG